jgi:hypothetical protein
LALRYVVAAAASASAMTNSCSGLLHRQDRTRRQAYHTFSDAAEQQMSEGAAAVRADDNHIGIAVLAVSETGSKSVATSTFLTPIMTSAVA